MSAVKCPNFRQHPAKIAHVSAGHILCSLFTCLFSFHECCQDVPSLSAPCQDGASFSRSYSVCCSPVCYPVMSHRLFVVKLFVFLSSVKISHLISTPQRWWQDVVCSYFAARSPLLWTTHLTARLTISLKRWSSHALSYLLCVFQEHYTGSMKVNAVCLMMNSLVVGMLQGRWRSI